MGDQLQKIGKRASNAETLVVEPIARGSRHPHTPANPANPAKPWQSGTGHDPVTPHQALRRQKRGTCCNGCEACATDEPCPFEDEVPAA